MRKWLAACHALSSSVSFLSLFSSVILLQGISDVSGDGGMGTEGADLQTRSTSSSYLLSVLIGPDMLVSHVYICLTVANIPVPGIPSSGWHACISAWNIQTLTQT